MPERNILQMGRISRRNTVLPVNPDHTHKTKTNAGFLKDMMPLRLPQPTTLRLNIRTDDRKIHFFYPLLQLRLSVIELMVPKRRQIIANRIHEDNHRLTSFYGIIHIDIPGKTIATIHHQQIRMYRPLLPDKRGKLRELVNLSMYIVSRYNHHFRRIGISATTPKECRHNEQHPPKNLSELHNFHFLFLTPENNNKVAGLQMSPNVKSHDDTKHSPRFHVTTPNNNKISIILFRPSKLIPMKPNNEWLKNLLNILVVAGSIFIIIIISIELLSSRPILSERFILNSHLIICAIFLADFLVRWYYSDRSWKSICQNVFLLLLAIPYLNIVYALSPVVPHGLWIALRLFPIVRGIYGISIIVSWMTHSKVTNLFVTYIAILVTIIYFCSIVFYFMEHGPNPLVKNYWDAFNWSLMNVTTVGSNIFGITKLGQSLAVALAAAGMIFFPIFTAWVTTKFQNKRNQTDLPSASQNL